VGLRRRPRRSDVHLVKYQDRCEWCALKEDDEEKTRGVELGDGTGSEGSIDFG